MCDLTVDNATEPTKEMGKLTRILLTITLAVVAAGLPAGLFAASCARADEMEIKNKSSREIAAGSPNFFTGEVRVDPLAPASHHTNTSAGLVTFSAGARSAWHTHPAGQTLIVTEGTGWVQEDGGKKIEIKPGDVIRTPPGVKHWHGATASSPMSHIALTENVDGKNVDWMEKVSDEQYQQ
ncbi:(R)-mandelonitrile lyase [Rhizobium leguminosarum]|uniref:(R)-mandelonitrile lyase n=1 Tax=Rhizobium leguminosarum TaxID=384 RepID=UPI003F9D00E0